MPPIRTPLGRVSGNSRRGPDLTPVQRAKIIGAAEHGISPSQIATTYGLKYTTIQSTIQLDPERDNCNSQPRSGRPKSYTDRDVRIVLRFVRKHPKATYTEVKSEIGLDISHSTIKRILRESGITNWRARRRPHLTEEHVQKRYNWCKARLDWSLEEWKNYMWSDECSVERGRGRATQWCFGSLADKWKPEFVQTYRKSKGLSIMIWACFWGSGRSDMYFREQD